MSKSDQNKAKGQAQDQINKNTSNEAAVGGQLQSILGSSQDKSNYLFPGITSGYSDMAATGGYDPSILGTVNSTYSDFAKTGGISDADATAMRGRASEAAQATYQTGQADAARATAATGGYGASGAIQSNLARKGSEAASRATTDVDASIAGMKQQGKLAGAAGLGSTQQNIAGNKLGALSGMTNIYGLSEQQTTQTVNQILQNYQQTGQLNNQDLSILTNLANQPGVFDKIVSTIGTLGGAAAGILKAVK